MATFSLSLGVPSTDHDTDMLSDAGRSDVDFDIEVDAPLAIGDQDDFMVDSFDAEADANDAEMLEEYDDQRVNEAEMYDDDLDEDDQMDNIDFDHPPRPSDSEPVVFATNADAPIQEHHIDFTNWSSEPQISQPNTTNDNAANNLEISTKEADPSTLQSPSDVSNTDLVRDQVPSTAQDTISTSQKTNENVAQSKPQQEDTEATVTDPKEPGTKDQDNIANDSAKPELMGDPEEDLITYDEEHGAESPLLAQETITGQPSLTAEISETFNDIPPQETNSDGKEAPREEEPLIESKDLNQSEIIQDSTEENKDEVYEEQSPDGNPTEEQSTKGKRAEELAVEQVAGHHENEDLQDYSYDVIVQYGGTQLSLFPPSRHDLPETYLLQDHSIAEKSLAELFAACREVLGGSISDRDALEIEIPQFELYIHEDSSECPNLSISQVVDVYFRLHENDGVEEPHPLTVFLKTRLRFGARLSSLFEAADAAKGLSALNEQHEDNHNKSNTVEEEEHGNAEYENDGHGDLSNIAENEENWNTEDIEVAVQQDGTLNEAKVIDTIDAEEQSVELSHSSETIRNDGLGKQHMQTAHTETDELANVDENENDGEAETVPEEGDLIDYLDDDDGNPEDSGRSSTIEGDVIRTESDNSNSNAVTTNSVLQDEIGTSDAAHVSEEDSSGNQESLQYANQESGGESNDEPGESETEGLIEATELRDEGGDPHSIDDQYPAEEDLEDEYTGSDVWHGEENTVIPDEALEESHKGTGDNSAHEINESGEEAEHDDFEINIRWDEEEENHEPNTKPESPLGKRNFDEHAEGAADGELDQEVKRVKST